MKSILYVSKTSFGSRAAQQEVNCIVDCARSRNRANEVTGMLVYTGDHFAQLLEGSEESVELIMTSIRNDPRHHSISEHSSPIEKRSFGAWSLGYEGQSTYVDRVVRSVYAGPDPDLDEAQAELRELMLLLAYQSSSQQQPSE